MGRASYIAVKLLLIVATATQPTFALSLRQACSIDEKSGSSCQGCGCCTVASESTRCGCCSGNVAKVEDRRECCASAAENSLPAEQVFNVESVEPRTVVRPGIVSRLNVEQASASPWPWGTPPNAQAISGNVRATCKCITRFFPTDASVPRIPTTDRHDNMPMRAAIGMQTKWTPCQRFSSSFDTALFFVTAHFSQLAFCVWRL
jgi:hypothetical protein